MLRPERMSKVSVTGSKAVMDDVIETVHDLNLLHLSDYDGSWEGFDNGNPIEGADAASEKLVTVRSLQSILDVEEADAGPSRIVTDDALEDELEEIRQEANELDDRRSEIEDELRAVEERIDSMAPFARLGIDLDLLSGYDTLQTAVGEGDAATVREALEASDDVEAFEVFEADEGSALAVFAYPSEDVRVTYTDVDGTEEDVLEDALVGAEFTRIEVPDGEGSPEEYLEEQRHRKQQLESKLDTVEDELEDLRLDAAGFLLAAEEKLSIEVEKSEAPLQFATTENAFVAEGWIPTDRVEDLESTLADAVGDRVEFEELERADYRPSGHGHDHDTEEVAADGGTTVADDPPVVQDNPSVISPFEVLTKAVSRPKYWEFDPTYALFLTFPLFFGFMIGDFGYGLAYTAIGYYLYTNFESDAVSSMGGVTIWAGLFTALFGFLYGEIFGLHTIGTVVWNGHPPIHKGIQPAEVFWAQTWLLVTVVAALAHLNLGYLMDFAEAYEFHGAKEAVLETGSWLLMMNGFWVFIFSRIASGMKPKFMFTVFDGTGAAPEASGKFVHTAFALGFNGFPPTIGYAGLAAFAVGLVLIWLSGEIGEAIEATFLQVLVNGLSYTRIAAVLLAKAGMAFVVNLLFFGAYRHEGEFHFLLGKGPEAVEHGHVMFPGLVHMGVAAFLVGLVVLAVGHLLVLALGVTSAGLQAIRLEYYEFFSKFYDGGGRTYEPFGHDREFTAEE